MQLVLLDVPLMGVYPCNPEEANTLIVAWQHRLGACQRPFGQQGFVLKCNGLPVSVAMSASIVSSTVAGYHREQVVECARLCSAPGNAWATRIMLRIWREVCAQTWPHWKVFAAVSYSHNAHHRGELYRFDGWTKVKEDCGSSGGGSWSRQRDASNVVYGKKTLWLYRWHAQQDGPAAHEAVAQAERPGERPAAPHPASSLTERRTKSIPEQGEYSHG